MIRILCGANSLSRSCILIANSRLLAPDAAERGLAGSTVRSDLECLKVAARMACIALVTVAVLVAQSFYGAIRGTVVDPHAGMVANAKVSLVDESTGVVRSVATTAGGEYVFSDVVPSTYSVVAESSGFKRFEQKHVVVGTQERVALDLQLEIGQVTETVEVNGEVALIETASASQGQTLDTQKLADLPNIGRNPFIMSKLAANVIPLGNPVYNRMEDQSGSASIAMAGGPSGTNNYLLDGVPISDSSNRGIIIPSIEATQEVKVQTNTYDAEIGRTGGGMFNTYLKSGGNDYHGSLFGSTRQTGWDANNYFNNSAGLPLSPQYNYTWGGSFGGRVRIPKIYDGKNHTFFFLAFEGYNDTQAVSLTVYTPTALERVGNFSQTTAQGGGSQVIYNPLSTVQNASGTYSRTPFAGNIIPASMINPVGLNIANTLALPNAPPAYYGAPDATAPASITSHARQYVGKLDEQFTDSWRATLSYIQYFSKSPGADYFGGISASEQWTLLRNVDATAINNLITLSPTTVLALRYGFNRFPNYAYNATQGFNATTLGFPASFAAQQQFPTFPVIQMSNTYIDPDGQGDFGTNQKYVYDFVSNNFSASIARAQGRHSLKAGFDFRRILVNGNNFSDSSGNFSFTGVFSQSTPTSAVKGTGADMADLLLGYPASGDALLSVKLTDSTEYYAAYVQDDFRLSNKLTVNIGLRWERELGISEANNGLVTNFNTTVPNPLAAGVTGISPVGVVEFAGISGNPTRVGLENPNKWGPRAGFAWQPIAKTVIRGGYGLFWAPQFSLGSPLATPGYSSTTTYIATTNGNATPAGSLSNPFPTGLAATVGNTLGALTGVGQSISIFDPTAKSPRVQQYSLDIQRELPGAVSLEVGFVGANSTHLPLTINENVLNPSLFSMGTALNQSVANPFYGHGGAGIVGTATVQAYQLLLPYPTFGSVSYSNVDVGHSLYDSMVVKVQKRFSKGLVFFSTFTWQKNRDIATGSDAFNLSAQYSLSTIEVPRRFTSAASYELPFGKGKPFLSGSKALDYVVGGWSVNETTIWQTGMPLAVTQSQNLNSAYGYGQRPNATGISPTTTGSVEQRLNDWINPAAFSQAPQFAFGNLSRTISLRGPGVISTDMSIFKNIPIRERVKAQFRLESFNVFNTPEFANPGLSFGSGSFGKITSQTNLGREVQMALRFSF